MRIVVSEKDFNVNAEIDRVRNVHIGAIVTFIGTVRDVRGDLQSLTLEHYPVMAQKHLARIGQSAREKHFVEEGTIYHRVGKLKPMDNIVLVICAAKHRQQSLVAVDYILQSLKTCIPFWKAETYKSIEHIKWIEGDEKYE